MYDNIVFFDGVCPICNFFIRFLLKINKKRTLFFSPLQGETFKKLLTEDYHLQTIVFYQNQKTYTLSEAVIRILMTSTPMFKFLFLFLLIPKVLRDFLYKIISRFRYKIFGQYQQCPMPDDKVKERFLP